MSKTRDTGYLANVIQVHDTGVRIMSGSTMLMAVSSSGAVTITGEISGSDAANARLLSGTGSVGFTTTSSFLAVSSSQQQVSASYIALSASYNTFSGSASTRITTISSSQQDISSSLLQVSASYISLSGSYNTFSGSASTRITANSSSIQQVSSSQQQISSSQQQISASLLNAIAIGATTGSNSFRANQSITGSLVVSSTITAQTLIVQTVTSSIIYSSGSNIFGCDLNSRQTFTGSIYQTGSIAAFAGSVGIQTTSPVSILHVSSSSSTITGKVILQSPSSDSGILQIGSTYGEASMMFIPGVTSFGTSSPARTSCYGNVGLWGLGAGTYTNDPTKFGIANVGFGTNILTVSSSGASTFSSTITGTTIYGSTAVCSPVGLFSGCVGIGTATPSSTYGRLTVAGTGISIDDDGNAKLQIGRYSSTVCNAYIKMGTNACSLRFTNNIDSIDLVTIEKGGNLLIGTTNADIGGSVSGTVLRCNGTIAAAINITSPANYTSPIAADRMNTAGDGLMYGMWRAGIFQSGIGANNAQAITFITGDGGNASQYERLRINGNGIACFACQVCAPSGVKFGSGATTLNYYEQGSWTPVWGGLTVGGTTSYAYRSGTYTRIGNTAFIRWGFKLSSTTGAIGTMAISGLPFTPVEWGSYQEPNISVSTGNLSSATYAGLARVFVQGPNTVLEGRISNNGDTAWNVNEFSGDEWVIGELFYNVS